MSQLNWYMARRYFFAKRSNRFISLVGGISIIGIALGVIALIITMAILNGFEGEVTRRIANFIPHVVISSDADIDQIRSIIPEAKSIYASTERKAVLVVLDDKLVLNIHAIDQDHWEYFLTSAAGGQRNSGRLKKNEYELPGIVIGAGIADKFFITAGDTLAIQSPLDVRSGLFRIPQRHFVVTGIFRSDIFDFDRNLAIIDYAEGRRMFKAAGKEVIHLQLDDFNDANNVKARLNKALPDLRVQTWHDQHKTLFDAMRMEKWGSFIGLNLIILIAVFNIVSSLMMMVLEKTGDIGILRVMGAQSSNIKNIFNLQGLIVAFLGVVLGVVVGTLLVLSQSHWGWITLPDEIYLIPVLPVQLYWNEVLMVGIVAFAIVQLSIRYPSKKAANLLPLDAINYKR
ncbi:MAG: FtsX-like permease family protein [Candidatus Marinimicrobia bacterium]|mgnify:CR=1 FL=1|jgi:lipoprotein-releasing system permease protein|nr:FtsX-like permease family protein [Candidatus Neomarinimicrobiota bacterium]MBT3630348.1 FtsX-like permease family protein [Candidatus Neomarinimicrobiota bacterium]MBT3823668.1 FtsX-like permease family protein [Candidatus Neomarinimicrobiota bacterium]MBT4131984.1 FtsX-like permease family protein [Candidatus Neomarinimicrobiota bacterium]MBT4294709.1 FtsX-like permease family protein [Candidatus Neomarinimicrobiota bacterium]